MKSKTGQESKYREHLLSDINIYLAIYEKQKRKQQMRCSS